MTTDRDPVGQAVVIAMLQVWAALPTDMLDLVSADMGRESAYTTGAILMAQVISDHPWLVPHILSFVATSPDATEQALKNKAWAVDMINGLAIAAAIEAGIELEAGRG